MAHIVLLLVWATEFFWFFFFAFLAITTYKTASTCNMLHSQTADTATG